MEEPEAEQAHTLDEQFAEESDQAWYFDLPDGAWERQEQKNRALRENVRQNVRRQDAAEAAANAKDPFKKRRDENSSRWSSTGGTWRLNKPGQEAEGAPADFEAEGAPGDLPAFRDESWPGGVDEDAPAPAWGGRPRDDSWLEETPIRRAAGWAQDSPEDERLEERFAAPTAWKEPASANDQDEWHEEEAPASMAWPELPAARERMTERPAAPPPPPPGEALKGAPLLRRRRPEDNQPRDESMRWGPGSSDSGWGGDNDANDDQAAEEGGSVLDGLKRWSAQSEPRKRRVLPFGDAAPRPRIADAPAPPSTRAEAWPPPSDTGWPKEDDGPAEAPPTPLRLAGGSFKLRSQREEPQAFPAAPAFEPAADEDIYAEAPLRFPAPAAEVAGRDDLDDQPLRLRADEAAHAPGADDADDEEQPRSRWDEMFSAPATGGSIVDYMREWQEQKAEEERAERDLTRLPAELLQPFDWETDGGEPAAENDVEGWLRQRLEEPAFVEPVPPPAPVALEPEPEPEATAPPPAPAARPFAGSVGIDAKSWGPVDWRGFSDEQESPAAPADDDDWPIFRASEPEEAQPESSKGKEKKGGLLGKLFGKGEAKKGSEWGRGKVPSSSSWFTDSEDIFPTWDPLSAAQPAAPEPGPRAAASEWSLSEGEAQAWEDMPQVPAFVAPDPAPGPVSEAWRDEWVERTAPQAPAFVAPVETELKDEPFAPADSFSWTAHAGQHVEAPAEPEVRPAAVEPARLEVPVEAPVMAPAEEEPAREPIESDDPWADFLKQREDFGFTSEDARRAS